VLIMTVLATTALGGIKLLVNSTNDVSNGNLIQGPGETVTTTRAAHAVDQLVAAQLAEQLLKIGQRYLLSLADAGQSNRPIVATHGKIHHGRNGETSFGCQTHFEPL
jgi:Zn-dependent M28 family amino/carboxypeptidase